MEHSTSFSFLRNFQHEDLAKKADHHNHHHYGERPWNRTSSTQAQRVSTANSFQSASIKHAQKHLWAQQESKIQRSIFGMNVLSSWASNNLKPMSHSRNLYTVHYFNRFLNWQNWQSKGASLLQRAKVSLRQLSCLVRWSGFAIHDFFHPWSQHLTEARLGVEIVAGLSLLEFDSKMNSNWRCGHFIFLVTPTFQTQPLFLWVVDGLNV